MEQNVKTPTEENIKVGSLHLAPWKLFLLSETEALIILTDAVLVKKEMEIYVGKHETQL